MVAALKVSPAPRVSMRESGGKAFDDTTKPPLVIPAAPSSPQAQITLALKEQKPHKNEL